MLQESRRRDGVTRNYVSRDRLRIERPQNVAMTCDLDTELDLDLLVALESATPLSADDRERLDDMVRLFVGANTDNDVVSEHSEVIDVVSVFNWLTDAEKAKKIVPEMARLLPDSGWRPWTVPTGVPGQAVALEATANDETIRSTWLRDLFSLRNPYGHGKVNAEHQHVRWSRAEHMLITALVVPLAVKAFLRERGLYTFSPTDERMDRFVSGVSCWSRQHRMSRQLMTTARIVTPGLIRMSSVGTRR